MDQYFFKALKHCYNESKFKTQKELALTAGISSSTLSEALNGKKAGDKAKIKVAKAFGYTLIDFIALGRTLIEGRKKEGHQTVSEETINATGQQPLPYDKVYEEHVKVLKQFPNREMALEANKILLEINQVGGAKALTRAMAAMLDVLESEKEQLSGSPDRKSGQNNPAPVPKKKAGNQ